MPSESDLLLGQRATFLHLDAADASRLRKAATDASPVSGLTHTFYRYPARFSPLFVRQAIKIFSARGDTVADPFMGGGTTLVEATTLGRYAFGTDISTLAAFVARVKTRMYADSELRQLQAWADRASEHINMHHLSVYSAEWVERGYLRHLKTRRTWRLAKATQQALASALHLRSEKVQDFARCVILRTAQWAMDGRKRAPSVDQFRQRLIEFAREMLAGAEQYRSAVESVFPDNKRQEPLCLNRPVNELRDEPLLRRFPHPKLIQTSPPYPGIHVLYHRWQVDGRKESPAPFWITNQLDGSGAKYYMLGDHREVQLRTYYDSLHQAFLSIRHLCATDTIVVQMVAFSNPEWQLPRYLDVMIKAGFKECILPNEGGTGDSRLWRKVPNRRWHADRLGETPGSNEVMLIHAPAASTPPRRHCLTDALYPRPVH